MLDTPGRRFGMASPRARAESRLDILARHSGCRRYQRDAGLPASWGLLQLGDKQAGICLINLDLLGIREVLHCQTGGPRRCGQHERPQYVETGECVF